MAGNVRHSKPRSGWEWGVIRAHEYLVAAKVRRFEDFPTTIHELDYAAMNICVMNIANTKRQLP